MKATLDLLLPSKEILRDGFWPRSRFNPSKVDQFQVDGTLQEEFAREVPHDIGCRHIVRHSHFVLEEMFMSNTFLQSTQLMREQIILL